MRKTCTFLLCCPATTTINLSVEAFSPPGTSIVPRHRSSSSSSRVLLFGTIRNDDFSKIFGSQEAAERRTRDLAREYHPPPPRKPKIDADADGGEGESSSTGGNEQRQEGEANKDSEESAAKKIDKTKVVRKYVPPPHL